MVIRLNLFQTTDLGGDFIVIITGRLLDRMADVEYSITTPLSYWAIDSYRFAYSWYANKRSNLLVGHWTILTSTF